MKAPSLSSRTARFYLCGGEDFPCVDFICVEVEGEFVCVEVKVALLSRSPSTARICLVWRSARRDDSSAHGLSRVLLHLLRGSLPTYRSLTRVPPAGAGTCTPADWHACGPKTRAAATPFLLGYLCRRRGVRSGRAFECRLVINRSHKQHVLRRKKQVLNLEKTLHTFPLRASSAPEPTAELLPPTTITHQPRSTSRHVLSSDAIPPVAKSSADRTGKRRR
jgi:hypothetical protein